MIDRVLMIFLRAPPTGCSTQHLARENSKVAWTTSRTCSKDSLGLCAELSRRSQQVVDTYQCEWKTRGDRPSETRKRFRTFVNKGPARRVTWCLLQERGQICPASAKGAIGQPHHCGAWPHPAS